MSIKDEYFGYLDHFDKTVPVCQLHNESDASNMIALRHDIDYDLDLALEMAFWEHEKKCRATYYVLNTADYWQDPLLIDKCLQLQDFGHEVGLHLNVLTEWISGGISNIRDHLLQLIKPLREGGVNISGVSAHGDKSCYKNNFINYWCFSELKPANPLKTETGLSAEGIGVDDKEFQIEYPSSGQLIRNDGQKFNLWSTSMKDLHLQYDAVHLSYDDYFTDSGGSWERSSDPMQTDLSKGRHQILMHPVHWKDSQKIYFFLSTARSGSKWLINMLDKATSLTARHEFTLNHTYENGNLVANKRTLHAFTDLTRDRAKTKKLINQARDFVESSNCDYAEANVYLEQFIPEFQEIFPDAYMIHLFRDPRDVVRSIMNRNWYDTPEDTAHPKFDVKDFKNLSQFSKACWYVRKTNETLLSLCSNNLQFEYMVSQPDYLPLKLRELGIPFFSRLAKDNFAKRINANTTDSFPPYEKWSVQQKREFDLILSPVNTVLNYKSNAMVHVKSLSLMLSQAKRQGIKLNRKLSRPPTIINLDLELKRANVTSKYCKLKFTSSSMHITPKGEKHAHALLGGGTWKKTESPTGWEAKRGRYFRGSMSVETEKNEGQGSLICLMYNRKGKLIFKRTIGIIAHNNELLNFSFRLAPETRRFNLAIYIPVGTLKAGVTIKDVHLQSVLVKAN